MKFLGLFAACAFFCSCNTSIGLWKDTKAGFVWTKNKIQGSGGGGSEYDYEYGAPVY